MSEATAAPEAAAMPRPAPPSAARRGPGPIVLLAVGIVLAGGLGYGGYMGWQMFFPSGPSVELGALEPQPLNISAAAPAAVKTAAEEAADSFVDDPVALALASPAPPTPEPAPEFIEVGEAEEAMALVTQGSKLFEAGHYDRALEIFRSALNFDPGNMDAKDWEIRAAEQVELREKFAREIASVRVAFSDYDYETALKKLYRVSSPTLAGEARVKQWTVTCWYNWGVLRLQAGRMSDAREKFQEALQLIPGDEETENHLEVLRRYSNRSPDSTFKAYSESIALRALE